MSSRLLVVQPEGVLGEVASLLERDHSLALERTATIHDALALLSQTDYRFLIADVDNLSGQATPFLKRCNRHSPLTDIILFSDGDQPEGVIIDLLLDRGLPLNEIREAILDAVSLRALLEEAGMFGHSANLRDAARRIRQVGPTDISVLILGPSGTGKELIARAIQGHSPRHQGEYLSINCASIPESLLESELFGYEKGAFTGADKSEPGLLRQADKGTLFLDEIGEMHPRLQAKLLRAIDTRIFLPVGGRKPVTVDVRFLAATNRDLQREVDEGIFRADLYYRLSVISIKMTRLAERPEDILPIIAHNLNRLSSKLTFSPDATDLLLRYSWPGNVRELTNFLQRLLVTVGEGEVNRETVASLLDEHGSRDHSLPVVTNIAPEESGYRLVYQALINLANEVIDMKRLLQERLGKAVPDNSRGFSEQASGDTLEEMEEQMIRDVLARTGGNRKRAASLLGIGERTLYRKLKKLNLT